MDELLFAGYSDPLLDFAQLIPPGYLDIPQGYDKFGWFYGVSCWHYRGLAHILLLYFFLNLQRNGSEKFDGTFNIFTGVDDISKLDVMDMWNYNSKTEYSCLPTTFANVDSL